MSYSKKLRLEKAGKTFKKVIKAIGNISMVILAIGLGWIIVVGFILATN